MPAPNIKTITLSDYQVNTGEEFTITVDVDSMFVFDDVSSMTWDTVENRNLTWDNIDDSE